MPWEEEEFSFNQEPLAEDDQFDVLGSGDYLVDQESSALPEADPPDPDKHKPAWESGLENVAPFWQQLSEPQRNAWFSYDNFSRLGDADRTSLLRLADAYGDLRDKGNNRLKASPEQFLAFWQVSRLDPENAQKAMESLQAEGKELEIINDPWIEVAREAFPGLPDNWWELVEQLGTTETAKAIGMLAKEVGAAITISAQEAFPFSLIFGDADIGEGLKELFEGREGWDKTMLRRNRCNYD